MGDCLEQPQAAGIPEKALRFTCLPFLLLLRFAALGVGTFPPTKLGVVEMPQQHLGAVLGAALLGFGGGR